jgi:hypothetical protein
MVNAALALEGYSWMDSRSYPPGPIHEERRMNQRRLAGLPSITELQTHFLVLLPVIQEYAEVAHAKVVNFHDREDAIADTIAVVWEQFLHMAEHDVHRSTSRIDPVIGLGLDSLIGDPGLAPMATTTGKLIHARSGPFG